MFIDLIPSSDIFLRDRSNKKLTLQITRPEGITSDINLVLLARGIEHSTMIPSPLSTYFIEVMNGANVEYSIGAEGCEPSFGNIRVNGDTTETIILEKIVEPEPEV